MNRAGFIILFLCLVEALPAQDPEFTQFHSTPLYLNPAFAGSEGCSRVALNYRNQWPGISGTFITYHISYDQYVRPLRGGLGIYAMYDNAGGGTIRTYSTYGVYAFKWVIKDKVSVSPSLKLGYQRKVLDWSKLNFGHQIDPRYGFIYGADVPRKSAASNFDMGAGVLVNTKKIKGGFAIDHITQPLEKFTESGTDRLPAKYTVHLAYDFQKDEDSKFTFAPAVLYQRQQNFAQLNLIASFRFKWLLWSAAYRRSDSFIFGFGVQSKTFRFGYTYDLTVSKLSNATAGSYEASLRFLFNCKEKKEKIIPVNTISF